MTSRKQNRKKRETNPNDAVQNDECNGSKRHPMRTSGTESITRVSERARIQTLVTAFRTWPNIMIPFGLTQDGERELIDLAFSKKKADDRKDWLRQVRPGTYLNHDRRDFIFRFHQQGIDPIFHGRQHPVHPLSGGQRQARSEKSYLGVLQTKVEKRNQGRPTRRVYL